MRKSALLLVLLFLATQVISQSYKFNRSLILGIGNVRSILQDKEGYLWLAIQDGKAGLCKYDGKTQTTYAHDPRNSNSLSNNQVRSIAMDREGIIWIATYDGVNRLDPLTETITHFKHEANDPLRIHRDSITSVLVDHEGYVWAGTRAGLSKLDPKTGKFVSYSHDPSDPGSLSHYYVYTIYEDRQHQIWVGSLGGGLSVMDKETGKFKSYTRRDNDEHSINSDTVSAIFEDSRGTFWVGTQNNGICILDRNTGQFTRHLYDESKPNKLSVPVTRRNSVNYIPFIQEDKFGEIWIGSFYDGVIKYDPVTKKLMRYGNTQTATRLLPEDAEDSNKFPEFAALSFSQTDDGLIWIGCLGSTYTLTREPAKFPHYPLKTAAVNSFYEEENGGLWIGMQEGLLYKSPTGTKTFYQHNPKQPNSVADNIVNSLVYDGAGNLWVGTGGGGVDKLDLKTRKFVNYKISASGRVDSNIVAMLYLDDENILWVATNTGLGTLNIKTGSVNRFFHNPSNSNSLSNNDVYVVNGNKNEVWIGTIGGLDRLDKHTGNWRHYLPGSTIQSIFFDSKGELWVGSDRNLYRYKKNSDDFQLYVDSSTGTKPRVVLNIIEDLDHNLWVTSTDNIYRINSNRNALVVLGSKHGIHRNGLLYASNLLTKDGRLFLGDDFGYYNFNPKDYDYETSPPTFFISELKVGTKSVKPGKNSPLEADISRATEIHLASKQNSFSLEFTALSYVSSEKSTFQYFLENYDTEWQNLGSQNTAYFFNLSPGEYRLHVKCVNSSGDWSEKSITIYIRLPWWQTWWGITLLALALLLLIIAVSYYRSKQLRRQNKILEEKVSHRTAQLKSTIENLKSTQTQLIQSEKMASLGELTAGIAHEIQNPLNFINNFAEVNRELLVELKEELKKGNMDEVQNIVADIDDNQAKIFHHGKRADGIVKSMLQHSRSSTSVKESVDINKLADEYLRLAYHGWRARDKSFNATLHTDLDPRIGNISIIPQDVGRVIMNLLTNAFYAVNQKYKTLQAASPEGKSSYQPTVSLATRKKEELVELIVTDNGDGIPASIREKIFQPFFTTKPTGQGTGLGLSLSYDIIHTHGGTMKVESKEGEFTRFIITLPV